MNEKKDKKMYQIDPNIADLFKARPSACVQIMAGANLENGLTAKQIEKYNEWTARKSLGLKPLTENQQAELDELERRKTAKPELPEGAKTYCKKWLRESKSMYNRRSDKQSKFTEKGLIVEDHAIDFIADYFDFGFLMKNEERFSNEFLTGVPDIVLKQKDLVIDNKSSWDCETFPIFEKEIPDSGYWWQAQCYMELTDTNNFKLVYTLMDTPINIIERECRNYSYKMGYGEVTKELMDEFVAKMTYKDIPDQLKIVWWDIKREPSVIPKIKNRVLMCREYIRELINEINDKIKRNENSKI